MTVGQSKLIFHSASCKMGQHRSCHGNWYGFGFEFYCECKCHQEKNHAIVEVRGPAYVAIDESTSESSNEGLVIDNKTAVGTNHSSTDKPVPQPMTSSGDQKSRVFSREN